MRKVVSILLGTALLIGAGAAVYAQGAQAPAAGPTMADITVKDPPGPAPKFPVFPPDKLQDFQGAATGEQHVTLWGDPSKPGPYGMLLRWNPGNSSRPHFHDQDRNIFVVSGTWWVSDSTHFDPKLTHPIVAGSYVHHPAGTIHWDGARAGGPPAVLLLSGMGPVHTIRVDENGKPVPRPDGATAPPSRPAQLSQ